MKKRVAIAIGVVALIAFCSATVLAANSIQISDFKGLFDKMIQSDETVLVTVNGDKIYKSVVDSQIEFSKLSYSLAVAQIESMNIPEAQKQELLKRQKDSQKTEDEILENYIKETVLLQEAERQGISVSDEEARSFALEQYTVLKNLALRSERSSDKKSYEFIKQYMKEMNLTEDQYIDKASCAYKKMLIINRLYETVVRSGDISDAELNTQNYFDDLLNQAKIEYMK